MKKLIVGNWKMNCLSNQAISLSQDISKSTENCEVVLCPPFTSLYALGRKDIIIGAQDCHEADSGAHTGDISAAMLSDIGCSYVILGHSERRKNHDEDSNLISKKAISAYKHQLKTIICVGETSTQRDNGQTLDVIADQLRESLPSCASQENTVIAYEPVWAIGTGKTPTIEQIKEVHDFITDYLSSQCPEFSGSTNILYGGSVVPDNIDEIFTVPSVGGVLVGGASLDADKFNKIIKAACYMISTL